MSHNTVHNTPSLLRRFTRDSQTRTGEISMHVECDAACVKENAPESMKMECGLVQAIKYGCGYVCQSSSNKSPVDSYLYLYVMEALLEVLRRGTPRNVCVFGHARSSVGASAYMRVCLSSSLSSRLQLVCICILTLLNNSDYIKQLFFC